MDGEQGVDHVGWIVRFYAVIGWALVMVAMSGAKIRIIWE